MVCVDQYVCLLFQNTHEFHVQIVQAIVCVCKKYNRIWVRVQCNRTRAQTNFTVRSLMIVSMRIIIYKKNESVCV